jgi:hypothetical protein
MKAVCRVTELTRIKPQVMIHAGFESKNTTGREKLVRVKAGLCINNSRPSEEYETGFD